jgi:hypothetical protein
MKLQKDTSIKNENIKKKIITLEKKLLSVFAPSQ